MVAKDFKELIQLIDEDFQQIAMSAFPRNRLYYSVTLNDRESNVLARKIRINGGLGINFLITQPHSEGEPWSSMLYLSDLDIIGVLSSLGNETLSMIEDFLIMCAHGSVNSTNFVQLEREEMYKSIDPYYVSTSAGMPLIQISDDISLDTPQGVIVCIQDFCDLISLTMAKEGSEKMKATATKYLVFSSIILSRNKGIPVPDELISVNDIDSTRKLYEDLGTNAQRRLDARLFDQTLYRAYFESRLLGVKL